MITKTLPTVRALAAKRKPFRMAHIIPIGDKHPQTPRFLAPNACLIGDIRFGASCSIWFGAVLRGDINYIQLGDRCNVQDNSVLHVSKKLPCILGNDVSMGHQSTAHACTVGDHCLLGMGSRVLDGAQLGNGVLVAAGCVVPEGMQVPDYHLIAGVPGRIIKPLDEQMRQRLKSLALSYVDYQHMYPDLLTGDQ